MSKKQKKEIEDAMKIITLGESGVGKTSIIRRYIHNIFDENNLSTIGLNFSFKEVKLKDGNTINLKLIDTAGQEKYRALAKSYFKNVDAALFVFAMNSQESFDNIKNWIKLFDDNHNGKTGIPKYLIGNKSDQEREVNDDLIEQLKNEYKDYKYFETSAKNNDGIENLFKEIGEDLYKILSEKEGKGRKKSQSAVKISKYKNKNKGNNCLCP
jgi:small GTP-binding protein